MKKLIYCAAALATALFAGSCQQELLDPAKEAGVVTYEVAIPELATKSYDAEGKNVNDLVYAVYSTEADNQEDAQSGELKFFYAVNETTGTSFDSEGKSVVHLELLNDQNYLILFWAQSNDAWVKAQGNNIDLRNVTYPTSMAANNEHLEAFSGVSFIKNVKGARKEKVTLTRPFAQINIATTMPKAFKATLSQSEMSVAKVAKSFNVATQTASDEAMTVYFTPANVPDATLKEGYTYAGANYIFANGNVDVTYKIYTSHGDVENTVTSAPVAKNYRTNIIGNLLTSEADYEVTLDKDWESEYVGPEFVQVPAYDADSKTWTVTNADELAWVAASVNGTIGLQTKAAATSKTFKGETVVLANDIDLQGAEWEPIGVITKFFEGTFDGCNKTISNYKVTEKASHAGLFGYARATIQNLKVNNVTLKANHYAGAIVGQGYCRIDNCHAENVNIIVTIDPTADNGNGDYGDKAGAIIGQNCEGNLSVTNCTAMDVFIEGYRDLGGIAGMAHDRNIVTGNSVENVTIVQNLTNAYKAEKPTTLGAIIGRQGANVTYENNTGEVTKETALAAGVYVTEYDADEKPIEYTVYAAEGLEWVSANCAVDGFEDKTIKLSADVDLFKGYMDDGDPVTTPPIGSTGERDSRGRLVCNAFKGTFDGQGHAIKNLYQNGWAMGYEWGQYGSIGLFSELEGATVKNITIEAMDALVEGGDISFIAGSATGDCVFENITINSSSIGTYNNGCGGIIGWSGAGTYTFKDITIGEDVVLGGLWGSFDSSIGGVVGQAEPGATYNFENVTVNCRIDAYNDCTASYDYYNYRMCGMVIGRCQKTTTIDGKNYPDLSQYNMTFNNVVVNYGDWMNYHYCRKSGERAARVEPGYAYGGISADRDHSTDDKHCMEWIPFNQLIGGDQYAVKGLPAVDGITVNYPESYYREFGYKVNGDTYTVLTGAGFKKVATEILSDASKIVTIELANDIDLEGIEWPAVCTKAAFFLDGKGKAIKNLTTTAVEDHGFYSTAMFTSTRKAVTIKNLVVENATVTGKGGDNSHGAVLVACNYAALNIEGVTVKNSTVSNCDRSSVITTYLYFTDATVKNCVVEGCTVNSIGTAGAILGMNNSHNFEATGNTVKNTTISSSEGSNKAGILIGTWQSAGTLTQSGNTVENSKAINAGTETNNEIGRTV